jgi:uncharacterized protein (TIGR02001 family)
MRSVAVAVAFTALAGTGYAQVRWSGEGGVASDYVKRGFSRSDDTAHLFGSATASSGSFYAGAFATTADLGDADGEVDLYVGWSPEAFGYVFDLSAARSVFLGDDDLSYTDVQLQASREIGPVRVAALVGGSPDYLGGGEAFWAQGEASLELYRRWTLSATLGREDSDGSDHTYWSLGSAYALSDRIGAELRYWGTDGQGDRLDDRLVFGVKASF